LIYLACRKKIRWGSGKTGGLARVQSRKTTKLRIRKKRGKAGHKSIRKKGGKRRV